MTYAREYEKELLHRPVRRRMGVPGASCPRPEQARTTEGPRRPRDPQRRLLRTQERLSLATLATRLPALGDCLLVVREVALGRHLRAAQRHATRTSAHLFGEGPASERGYRRLPVREDHRGWRRTEGLRRQQEGARQEATPAGGHRGVGPQSQGSQRQGPRPGRPEAAIWSRRGAGSRA